MNILREGTLEDYYGFYKKLLEYLHKDNMYFK